MSIPPFRKIAVIGGAGYVGSALAPYLIEHGYDVKVLDLFLFGTAVFDPALAASGRLSLAKVDMRDERALREELSGMEAVIHLACISNDPSFELDPALGKSINYDALPGVLRAVRDNGVRRFLYASSSSVYGVKDDPDVREETPCDPLTDYSKYKLLTEELLASSPMGDTDYVIVRPATVCGYAPRLRLDLTVNILTLHALVRKVITVFGGDQLRPNLNIRDMVEVYRLLLEAPSQLLRRQVFNAGYRNLRVAEIAELVKREIGDDSIEIKVQPSNDNRSYHVNSDKIRRVLGFSPRHSVEEAVQSLVTAYRDNRIPEALTRPDYYNIKVMQNLNLQARSETAAKPS